MTERRWIVLCAMALLIVASLCVPAMRVADRRIDVTSGPEYLFEGFSAPDGTSRRSTTAEPRVRFDRPLPRRFTLRVSGHATTAASGMDVGVRVAGGEPKVLRMSATESTQDVELTNPWLASAIAWELPAAARPDGEPAANGRTGTDADRERPSFALTRIEVLP